MKRNGEIADTARARDYSKGKHAMKEAVKTIKRQAGHIVAYSNDEFRQRVIQVCDEPFMDIFPKAIKGAPPFTEPQAWAHRYYLELRQVVGTQPQMLIAIEQKLVAQAGAKDLAEVQQSVSVARAVTPLLEQPEAMADRMLEWLRDYFAPMGKRVMVVEDVGNG